MLAYNPAVPPPQVAVPPPQVAVMLPSAKRGHGWIFKLCDRVIRQMWNAADLLVVNNKITAIFVREGDVVEKFHLEVMQTPEMQFLKPVKGALGHAVKKTGGLNVYDGVHLEYVAANPFLPGTPLFSSKHYFIASKDAIEKLRTALHNGKWKVGDPLPAAPLNPAMSPIDVDNIRQEKAQLEAENAALKAENAALTAKRQEREAAEQSPQPAGLAQGEGWGSMLGKRSRIQKSFEDFVCYK